MADMSTERFLQAYGHFLVTAWGAPPLKNRFKQNPEQVLKEFGLDPEGAKVVIESPGGKPGWIPDATPESQVKLWNEGKKAGKIRFIFPDEPPQDLRTAELTDKDLEAVAGGGNYCCCCSPCCCC
jgi:hypothetical protein